MWKYKQTQELYHAGVKGMKWGVRKDKEKTSSDSDTTKKTLSDKEKIINEYEKEKKERNKQRVKKGAKAVYNILIGTSVTAGIAATAFTAYIFREISK